tara:strand:+ start:582 stop:791 length:210 start_codon:yes stop_codon:yes gene_type:complete
MEQLYPLNIIERRFPVLREQREKAEREAVDGNSRMQQGPEESEVGDEPGLYSSLPYEGGEAGKHLNTLA